jgi:hypothetical protein
LDAKTAKYALFYLCFDQIRLISAVPVVMSSDVQPRDRFFLLGP